MQAFERLTAFDTADPAPAFDVDVPETGYRWWYVDGISEDGRCGIVIIAFIGSVFSPYYFSARKRGAGDPFNHCAINVGLYRPGGSHWCMTERGRRSVTAEPGVFRVGPSQVVWRNNRLTIDIDERTTPLFTRLRGRIVVTPDSLNRRGFQLDTHGHHRWRPIAPSCDIDVDFEAPRTAWRGHGYFDTNDGARPLEADFRNWSWSRRQQDDRSLITYSIVDRDNRQRATAVAIDKGGGVAEEKVPAEIAIKPGLWRVSRSARTEQKNLAIRDLEDTPFYTRSLLIDEDTGSQTMHEFLDLDRFRSRWVRLLLPFRMPRVR